RASWHGRDQRRSAGPDGRFPVRRMEAELLRRPARERGGCGEVLYGVESRGQPVDVTDARPGITISDTDHASYWFLIEQAFETVSIYKGPEAFLPRFCPAGL